MDTGILPTVKRDADDEDIYILAEGLRVSLAGLPDLGPTLSAAFPGSSHETYFLARQSLYGSSQIADLGDGRFQ
jgi:hypothetical protein